MKNLKGIIKRHPGGFCLGFDLGFRVSAGGLRAEV